MAKSKTKRKQAEVDGAPAKKLKTSIPTPPPDGAGGEAKTIQSIGLDFDDLELAIDTLNILKDNPNVIKSKGCKDLRTAVYEFRQACTTGFNAAGLLFSAGIYHYQQTNFGRRHKPHSARQWSSRR